MDKEGILAVLHSLGAGKTKTLRGNIQCACFLANYRDGHSRDSDHADSMGILINPHGPSKVNCFACKFKGNMESAVKLLAKHSGKDFTELLKTIREREQLSPQQLLLSVPQVYGKPLEKEADVFLPESELEQFTPGTVVDLLDRGLTPDTLKTWGSMVDYKKFRVVFPVRTLEGKLFGAVGRTYVEDEVRYHNYFHFDKSRHLFGEHLIKTENTAILVEGLLDTLAVWQWINGAGLHEKYAALGVLGSEASENQIRVLSRNFKQVVVFFDNDPAGWTGTRKVSKELSRRISVRYVDYPTPQGGDPMDLLKTGGIGPLVESSSMVIM